MQATYESRCGWCQGTVHEGDDIDRLDDEWCHTACVQEALGGEDIPIEEELGDY